MTNLFRITNRVQKSVNCKGFLCVCLRPPVDRIA